MITGAAEAGGGPLRSESARLPSVTLALAAPGLPVQLRWTTLRVQGPTLRDAALANGGHGSPPVAPRLLHQPIPESFSTQVNLAAAGEGICKPQPRREQIASRTPRSKSPGWFCGA